VIDFFGIDLTVLDICVSNSIGCEFEGQFLLGFIQHGLVLRPMFCSIHISHDQFQIASFVNEEKKMI
jgi:hypothetical protein